MSDKEIVLDLVKKLPESTKLSDILEQIRFLAGIREAEEEASRGELIDHERIKEDLATWLSN